MSSQDPDRDHPLRLYNSLTRTVEQFVPQDPSRVTMYNCGPTVYSYAHIGNARAAVVADVLFRVLRHIYGEEAVVYARNITDVDDKIIASAKEQGVPISEITEKYARIYNEDLAALNCLPPTHQPKATDAIDEMQDIIVELLEKGVAYIADGQVLFDVSKDDGYGRLINKAQLEGASAGIRVEVASYKRNSGDFVLWKYVEGEGEEFGYQAPRIQKFADDNWRKFFNEPKLLSPGRPGWHIECSAMIRKQLGETIDIHCGGVDLKFPHHENECAQSQCANGQPLANFWVHNEFLNMGKDKMSKSLGNIVLVHDLLKEWDGEVIRLALLKAHYRSELVWSEGLLKESEKQLDGWYREKIELKRLSGLAPNQKVKHKTPAMISEDLGIPKFLSMLDASGEWSRNDYDSASEIQKRENADWNRFVDLDTQTSLLSLLGLLQRDPDDWFAGNASDDDKARFDALAEARAAARASKDWAETDRIRDEGAALGIVFEDSQDGTTWRKA